MKTAAVLVVLLAVLGCSTPPPAVDIETIKIHEWVEAYLGAAVSRDRDREKGQDNVAAAKIMDQALQDLRRLYPYPDGATYIEAELGTAQAYWGVKREALRKREGELFALRNSLTAIQRDTLEAVVQERDASERRVTALELLGPAIRTP